MPKLTANQQAARFWSRLVPDDGCLLWPAGESESGYGSARWLGRTRAAHKLAYELARGPVPAGMLVLHTCDRRRCCNPAHLFLGTQKANMQDAAAKGRLSAGERHAKAVLTVELVGRLRAGHTGRRGYIVEQAAALGVHPTTVGSVLAGRTWKSCLPGVDTAAPPG